MPEILPSFVLPESELRFSFSRAGGPGGQNVNQVATRTNARPQIRDHPRISVELRERLMEKLGRRRMSVER